ncbi:sensor histidine kinase [Bacillus massiliigorillae]|uniref:sensor histidine kinase n=1 Tax=Bacillus massiliigorillae TaxID=1243664 RepID=UPI00039EFC02|nr:sensor histidine kinase [Bacillus massiliigorillae]
MFELLPLMLERVGLLIILAFLLSRLKSFRQMIHNEHGKKEKAILILIFGIFGVISNYTGIQIEKGFINAQVWQVNVELEGALANTRVMGVAIGGLLGGPIVGLGVGLIAGLHRLTLGGFTAVACGVSTIIAGIITGLLGKKLGIKKSLSYKRAVVIGIVMEVFQMAFILLVAKPFSSAVHLVEIIAIPMIVMNGFGTLMFMLIIKTMVSEEERTQALQTHKALHIAQLTLPHFRKGLNEESCQKVAEIIYDETKADAISITDNDKVLAHIGAGGDHHSQKQNILTKLTKKVLEQGRIITAKNRIEIGCNRADCPLQAAIVLPLNAHHQTVGSLKMYFTNSARLTTVEQELAEGLSKLFSTQLELAEAELQRKLLKDAEIKALHAQVHPHFLFNSLNTISSLVRIDADKARNLLIQLSTFFRSNIHGARQMLVPLSKELEHVEAYLSIEQARFPDKYLICMDIDPALKEVLIPPFTLQPLVENAIHHAFVRTKKGNVIVRVFLEEEQMVVITEDNGIGISPEHVGNLGNTAVHSPKGTGTALRNIKQRIEELYGDEASFEVVSQVGRGTKIIIRLPLKQSKWSEEDVKSLYSG